MRLASAGGMFALVLVLSAACGCGSGSNAKSGPIVFAGGTPANLSVGSTISVSMMPVHDALGAGVDWTATCGGSPVTGLLTGGACGTFSPAHTADGAASIYSAPSNVPIGDTVTITAAMTSDPSATSNATVSIKRPSISISFTSAPVTSLETSQSATFSVLVANDPADAGASWTVSCAATGAGACGTLGSAAGSSTEYTAPSTPPSGAVTITAASVTAPSVTISASFTVTQAPAIGIRVSPNALTIGSALAGETVGLVATVSNDPSAQGVDWTVNCTSVLHNCGNVFPSHTASGAVATYTAPPQIPTGGKVTITATATATKGGANPQAASSVATIISSPTISANVSAPQTLAENSQVTLTASVTNDASNAGVSWSASCGAPGACGGITSPSGSDGVYTAIYTAPAGIPDGGEVLISATPIASSPASNPGIASILITTISPAVSIVQQPPASLAVNGSAQVSAAVTHDSNPPEGIFWSVQCPSPSGSWACGYVSPYQTQSGTNAVYTAPPVPPPGPVTIVASAASTCAANSCSATASSSVSISSSSVLEIAFTPVAPTQLQAAASLYLNAKVANDSSNAGVDWQVCADGCGFFTVVPQIPPPPKTPKLLPTPAVTATSVKGWPNGLPILYTAPANAPASGTVAISATADANPSVTTVAAASVISNGQGPALYGSVRAGSLPVTGAQVGLYAAGTSGYGSASTLVSPPGQSPYAVTDSHGGFTFAAGYSCPQATSQMYLVAIGGTPGTGSPNADLAMMTALGPCGALSSTPIVVNEVTTVGSAWALARFAANPLTTGLTSYLNIGTSSGNAAGLANAFAAAGNLVNITTGQAQFLTVAQNAQAPYATIDTLADILNTCEASPGGQAGDGSACGNLFTWSNPYRNFQGQTFYNGVPSDTLQAAFEIAQNPDFSGNGPNNVAASIDGKSLFASVPPGAPFQPVLDSTPFDFSLAVNYTSGGGLNANSGAGYFALDSTGDLWISNSNANNVTELNNQGASVTPQGGYSTSSLSSPGPIAIDASGYAWICGANGLTELNFVGQELPDSPFLGVGLTTAGCIGMAIDGLGDIWATSSQSISRFDQFGNPLSPAGGYTVATSPTDSTTVGIEPPIAFDNTDNVWLGVNSAVYPGSLSLAELSNASVLPNFLSPQPLTGAPSNFVNTGGSLPATQIAVDGSGNVWGGATISSCAPGSLFEVGKYKGTGTTDRVSAVGGSIAAIDPFRCSSGVAVDGAGVVWAASVGGPADPLVTPPNIGGFNPSLPEDVFGFVSPTLVNGPEALAVDSSGNVWVLLADNTITEFIGVATPAETPLSLAVKNSKLGSKP